MPQLTLEQLFKEMGHDPTSMVVDQPIDVRDEGWEVESFDIGSERRVWSRILHIVAKEDTDAYFVPDIGLTVSPHHRFYAVVEDADGMQRHGWIEAQDCVGRLVHMLMLDEDGEPSWVEQEVVKTKGKTKILDMEVEGTASYFSNGVLSHNTLYGDPDTTPGGQAIPFHASVRLKLTSGNQIKGKDKGRTDETKDDVIAIKVIATTIKNKVSSPRRKAEFEIHFGVGIEEHEQLLDEVNRVGEVTTADGFIVSCGGHGAWKEFVVADAKSGEVIHKKKFTKNMFGEVLANQVWRPYIDELLDKALIKLRSSPTLESELEAEEAEAAAALEAMQSPAPGVTGA